ncbi:DUF3613 domain-containing protein [Dyella sp. A6]|uniref:DUF3613 domain-containing protein n=1 Tax=Dyella aluminiiresistens TaxID=3069105 RepID=UPI002E779EE6|nr:DUF3613 domain-containing protein [Dyella sp. A6]
MPLMRQVMAFVALGLLPCTAVLAQQQPITGQMVDGAHAVAAPPATTPDAVAVPMQAMPAQVPVPSAAPAADMAVAPTSEPAQETDPDAIGYVTRRLLRMQVSGTHAGPALPMLGDEASAAYRRYMQSFSHPIPEFFETTVSKGGNGVR